MFPGIVSEGCYFHLAKRLDYHVKSLGPMEMYKNETYFRLKMNKLAALAFVPFADVVATFESHAIQFLQDELPLLSYVERTWVGAPVAGIRRLGPKFPMQMWNVLDRASTGSTRTTNALEAYHHSFNARISCQHPTIWKLLDSLKNQQALSTNTIQRVERCCSFRPSAAKATRNTRIQNLIDNYTRADADRLLRGIAFNCMM